MCKKRWDIDLKKVLWFCFIVFELLYFFWKTRYVIFHIEEEQQLFYIAQKGDLFLWLDNVSHQQGRFIFYILSWFWAGPMLANNPMVYRVFLCLMVSLDVIVFFRLIYIHINKELAFFITAVLAMTFQISDQHNLLISYAFLHVGFISLVLSVHLLLDYCKGKRGYSAVVWSAGLSFFACCFQENFLLFYILSFVIMFACTSESHLVKRFWTSLWKLRFHVLGGIIFLGVYFGFRMQCGGSEYEGNHMYFAELGTSLKVLFRFITGMVPGRTFMELAGNGSGIQLLKYIGKKDIIVVVLEAVFASFLLYKSTSLQKTWKFVLGLGISSFLACVLHSFSPQYISWVSENNTYAYVPSYYCCFFLVAIFCVMIVKGYHFLHGKSRYVGIVVFAVFMCSVGIMTVSVNNYYAEIYGEKYFHYENYRAFFANCNFEEWDKDAQVLIEDAYPVVPVDIRAAMTTYWYDAFFFNVVNSQEELDLARPYYILRYNADDSIQLEYIEKPR